MSILNILKATDWIKDRIYISNVIDRYRPGKFVKETDVMGHLRVLSYTIHPDLLAHCETFYPMVMKHFEIENFLVFQIVSASKKPFI